MTHSIVYLCVYIFFLILHFLAMYAWFKLTEDQKSNSAVFSNRPLQSTKKNIYRRQPILFRSDDRRNYMQGWVLKKNPGKPIFSFLTSITLFQFLFEENITVWQKINSWYPLEPKSLLGVMPAVLLVRGLARWSSCSRPEDVFRT